MWLLVGALASQHAVKSWPKIDFYIFVNFLFLWKYVNFVFFRKFAIFRLFWLFWKNLKIFDFLSFFENLGFFDFFEKFWKFSIFRLFWLFWKILKIFDFWSFFEGNFFHQNFISDNTKKYFFILTSNINLNRKFDGGRYNQISI